MKVRRSALIALLCTTVAIFGRAQTAPLRIVGLVEVPRLFNRYSPEGKPIPPAKDISIKLRTRPALDSPIAATIVAPDQLNAKEHRYDERGAVVYARDRNWSLVETSKGVTGWLAPADAGAFHSFESLIRDYKRGYLTGDWNGFVSESPDGARRVRVPGDPARTLVGFLVPQPRTATVQPVFARPDRSARVIRRVTTKNLDALQTTGSIPHQVLVLERRPGWYRVAPANQSLGQMEGAWLEEASAWRFHAVTDDVERGKLAERAWGPEKWRTRTVGTRRVGDALWFEVEVLSHSFCEDPRRPAVVRARGWIPAHAPSGLPNIWFYSRGC
jgi:hypothetical protein